jgi:hypothetical protein
VAIFISEEITPQMELYWSSSLQFELVVIYMSASVMALGFLLMMNRLSM